MLWQQGSDENFQECPGTGKSGSMIVQRFCTLVLASLTNAADSRRAEEAKIRDIWESRNQVKLCSAVPPKTQQIHRPRRKQRCQMITRH